MNDNLKFKDKYRIPSARLQGYDYGQNGAYFITICTKDRIHYFGEIPSVETQYLASPTGRNKTQYLASPTGQNKTQSIASLRVKRSVIGEITNQCWLDISKYFPFVELDEFVVMPNHIHGIIIINKKETPDVAPVKMQYLASPTAQNKTQYLASTTEKTQSIGSLRYENKFGPQSSNLASIIRGFKSGVKSYAAKNKIEFVWQERFYDRIIRDANEMERIRQYIFENPLKWNIEQNNPANIYM